VCKSFKQNSCHFRVPSLPDVAGGGGSGGSSGVQSTSQDIPTLDLLWVESKSKKAALKVYRVYVLISNHMKYKYFMACRLWLSHCAVLCLHQGGSWFYLCAR
jgi:hypothetical protein